MGTSSFAVPILAKIANLDIFDLVSVYTQPDRPAGRKKELKASDVKQYCVDNRLIELVKQPEKIRSEKEMISNSDVDLIVVASYGQIIPRTVIDAPKIATVNFHGSLLPKYRGAVPVQMTILNGDKVAGVALQKMVFELDAGDIIASREVELNGSETTETLMVDLANISAEMVGNELVGFCKGTINPVPQDDSKPTFCYQSDVVKEKAEITFETDLALAERMVRAFYPWPVAWFSLNEGKRIKVFKSRIASNVANEGFGLRKEGTSLFLDLNNGSLELLELQLEGKTRRPAEEYLYLVQAIHSVPKRVHSP